MATLPEKSLALTAFVRVYLVMGVITLYLAVPEMDASWTVALIPFTARKTAIAQVATRRWAAVGNGGRHCGRALVH